MMNIIKKRNLISDLIVIYTGSLLPQGVGGSDPQQKMDYPFLTPDDA